METKICISCEMEKPIYSFNKTKRKDGNGRQSKCSTCRRGSPSATHRPYLLNSNWVKFCKNCQTIKNLEDFTRRGKSYGLCKICNTRISLDYYHNLSEEKRAILKEKKSELDKKYKQNKEKRIQINEKRRERWKSDSEFRNRMLKSDKRSLEIKREYAKKYYRKNHESCLMYASSYKSRKRGAKLVFPFSKAEIIKRDGLNCYLCGIKLTEKQVTLDHLIPLVRGGDHKAENIKIACKSCNSSKSDKTLSEYKKWRGDYSTPLDNTY